MRLGLPECIGSPSDPGIRQREGVHLTLGRNVNPVTALNRVPVDNFPVLGAARLTVPIAA